MNVFPVPRLVYGGYFVHVLAVYLQYTSPVRHPLPPVSLFCSRLFSHSCPRPQSLSLPCLSWLNLFCLSCAHAFAVLAFILISVLCPFSHQIYFFLCLWLLLLEVYFAHSSDAYFFDCIVLTHLITSSAPFSSSTLWFSLKIFFFFSFFFCHFWWRLNLWFPQTPFNNSNLIQFSVITTEMKWAEQMQKYPADTQTFTEQNPFGYWRCDTMSHDLLLCDIIILFDISMILEGHMTCLHKHQNSLFGDPLWLCHHLFFAHHVTSGHVTFPTLSSVYIPAGVGFCSLFFPPSPAGKSFPHVLDTWTQSFSPISYSDFNKSDVTPPNALFQKFT